MPAITPRLRKRNALLRAGFLPREALELSKIPWDAPYVKDMIKDRRKLVARMKEEKLSPYKEIVEKIYIKNGFITKGTIDFWKFIRWESDRSSTKYPEYESPSKRGKPKATSKKIDGAMAKEFDRGESKYPKGAAYR